MKVALIQFNASADKGDNLRRAKAMVLEAIDHKAKWILLPEIFSFRGNLQNKDVLQQAAEGIPDTTTKEFSKVAKLKSVHILLGSLFEKAPKGKAYNTSVAIAPDGKIVKYRKIHLFDARLGDNIILESNYIVAGQKLQTALVGEFEVGLSVCYDLRFPALYQAYAHKGATVMTVPSCFTKITGEAHWEALLRARAIENLSYVLAPNQVGKDARGVFSFGNSLIVDPWGTIIARGSNDQEEIIYADIHQEKIKEARSKLPGLFSATSGPASGGQHRRSNGKKN